MSSVLTQIDGGLAAAGTQLGLTSIIPQGQIGGNGTPGSGIDVLATIEEQYEDRLEITDHPVETGTDMSDHSYMRPYSLVMRCGWTNSTSAQLLSQLQSIFSADPSSFSATSDTVSAIYSQLRALQLSRQPFNVITTLRNYTNMMMTSLAVVRDEKTSQSLLAVVTMRSVNIVSTQTATLPPTPVQLNPEDTSEIQNLGVQLTVPATPSLGGSLPPSNWSPPQSSFRGNFGF
jgi:hypothetical protein